MQLPINLPFDFDAEHLCPACARILQRDDFAKTDLALKCQESDHYFVYHGVLHNGQFILTITKFYYKNPNYPQITLFHRLNYTRLYLLEDSGFRMPLIDLTELDLTSREFLEDQCQKLSILL